MSLEKKFADDYVNLINKSRSLEQDVILKDKMIELMADELLKEWNDLSISQLGVLKTFKNQAISELVAEQNKRAADNASI